MQQKDATSSCKEWAERDAGQVECDVVCKHMLMHHAACSLHNAEVHH